MIQNRSEKSLYSQEGTRIEQQLGISGAHSPLIVCIFAKEQPTPLGDLRKEVTYAHLKIQTRESIQCDERCPHLGPRHSDALSCLSVLCVAGGRVLGQPCGFLTGCLQL